MAAPLRLGLIGAGNIAGAHLKGALRVPDAARFTCPIAPRSTSSVAEPRSSGRDNLGTMAIVFGVYASSRRGGQAVELAELITSGQVPA